MKIFLLAVCLCLLITPAAPAQENAKPKVAMFPLGGSSTQDLRDRVGFSIRAKLDRDGTYEPLDGPAMIDLAAAAKGPLTYDTEAAAIKDLAQGSGAVVLVWGDISPAGGKDVLRLKTLDLRQKQISLQSYQAPIADETQVRFVVERYLQTLPGIGSFSHPNDQAVHHDPISDRLFAENPNLVVDGDFSQPGHWQAIYQMEKYDLAIEDQPPGVDRVDIFHQPDGNALAMNLDEHAAQLNGMAALSDPIAIQPGVRYRIKFRYRSDGPRHQALVKGYALGRSLAGAPEDIEVYRLQVPPGDQTGGKWITVEADLDPHNPDSPVQRLRVDLYAYLNSGTILFDDVVLKAVGRQTGAATNPSP